jgi:hypothetical protein
MIAAENKPYRKTIPPRRPAPYRNPLRKKPMTISAGYPKTLKVTPAMESGLATNVWELKDLIAA